jgi:hypothetical protein
MNSPSRSQPMTETPPLPWRYQEISDAYTHIVRSGDLFIFQLSQDTSGKAEATARLIVEAVNNHEALKARIQELEELGQFLVDRLEEFDPGDDQPEREFHGHVAPAVARLRFALKPKDGEK